MPTICDLLLVLLVCALLCACHVQMFAVGCGDCCPAAVTVRGNGIHGCVFVFVLWSMCFPVKENGVWCSSIGFAEDPSSVVVKEFLPEDDVADVEVRCRVIRYPTLLEKKLLLLCVDIVFVKELLVMVWQTLGL
jgi:hypothetical protein